MAIDTLKVARRLRDAGFSDSQAEAVVAAVQEGESAYITKRDLTEVASELRSEMRQVEFRLETKLEGTKTELISRIFTMILGTVLVNVVAIRGAMFAFARLLGH